MICFSSRVLPSAAHRLWRVDVDGIAAAMTHSYSFFAALYWGAPMGGSWEWLLPRILLGGENDWSAARFAENAGTIPYEVVCDIGKRVPRLFLENGHIVDQLNYIVPHISD